jgi:energy-coupling factor transport system permease protein
VWALGLAVAATNTTNPVLLALLVACAALVVAFRRPDAPWALSFSMYLWLGLFIIVMRTLFRVVFSGDGPTVLFTIPFPQVLGGQLFGPVSAEALCSGLYDGARLAAMVICIGAANSLANAKRLLQAVPPALYELGSVIVVAFSVFPQLAESVRRVSRARKLRADGEGRRNWLRQVLMPVFVDALDRSVLLAAAMDSRGYGRQAQRGKSSRRVTSLLLLASMLLLCLGAYAMFDISAFSGWGLPLLLVAVALAGVTFTLAGRRTRHTRYRPDRWQLPESLVAASGVLTAAGYVYLGATDAVSANPSIYPLVWPQVSVIGLLAGLVSLLPILLAPPANPRLVDPKLIRPAVFSFDAPGLRLRGAA